MWNALKQFIRTLDEQGRARFMGLASDRERSAAMLANTGIGAATGFAALSSVYFALYLILAILFLRDDLGNPQLWLRLYYVSLLFGLVQGGATGGIVGRSLSLMWQGKRRKAALTCLEGGALIVAVLVLFSYRLYDPSIPLQPYILWTLLLFSPGYLAAASVLAWGVNLLSKE